MAYLYNNKGQFQDAIELAYEQTSIMAQVIEKDYYITMLLRFPDVNVPQLLEQIIEEKVYKNDYDNLT